MEIGTTSGGLGNLQLNINVNGAELSDWVLHSPNPKNLYPTSETRKPKLETRKPKPETRNPKPGATLGADLGLGAEHGHDEGRHRGTARGQGPGLSVLSQGPAALVSLAEANRWKPSCDGGAATLSHGGVLPRRARTLQRSLAFLKQRLDLWVA